MVPYVNDYMIVLKYDCMEMDIARKEDSMHLKLNRQ